MSAPRLPALGVDGGPGSGADDGSTAGAASSSVAGFSSGLRAGATGAGDGFATGFLYGVHEGWTTQECLRGGVCVAAQSLSDPTPSGGILPMEDCLGLGEEFGYRELG